MAVYTVGVAIWPGDGRHGRKVLEVVLGSKEKWLTLQALRALKDAWLIDMSDLVVSEKVDGSVERSVVQAQRSER